MTAIPSDANLSRFYDAQTKPFRFTRKTAFALSVAIGFHALVGYYAAKGHFQAITPVYEDEGGIVVVPWEKPKIPPPEPRPFDNKAPVKPPSFETHVPPLTQDTPQAPPFYAEHVEAEGEVGPVAALPDPRPIPVEPTISRPPAADPLIRNPTWLKKPTADQISNLYPNKAIERGIGGGATLLCEVAETGVVGRCAVVDESPKGYRFGEAALAMTRYFRMNPRTIDGAIEAGSKVRIPIVFNPG